MKSIKNHKAKISEGTIHKLLFPKGKKYFSVVSKDKDG